MFLESAIKLLLSVSLQTMESIFCPELGNEFFSNMPPYHIIGNPRCKREIRFILKYVNQSGNVKECGMDCTYLPNEMTSECVNIFSKTSSVDEMFFIVHGFLESERSEWVRMTGDHIMLRNGTAVVTVGWGPQELFNYEGVAGDTR